MSEIIIEAWKKELATLLREIWGSIVFWRRLSLFLISLLIVTIYIVSFNKDKLLNLFHRTKSIDHDKEIFNEADKLMREEDLKILTCRLINDNAYFPEEIQRVDNFLYFFNLEKDQFINKSLRKYLKKLCLSLWDLNEFCALNFFQFGPRDQLVLHPKCNLDRAGYVTEEQAHFYESKKAELKNQVDTVNLSYKEYRERVRKVLYV